MPRVRIWDEKQYIKAIGVLTRVGGTWQGVGQDEWYLHVSLAQYQALLDAKVVTADNGAPEKRRAKKSKRKARL